VVENYFKVSRNISTIEPYLPPCEEQDILLFLISTYTIGMSMVVTYPHKLALRWFILDTPKFQKP